MTGVRPENGAATRIARSVRIVKGWLVSSRRDIGTAVGAAAIVLGLLLGSPNFTPTSTTTTTTGTQGPARPTSANGIGGKPSAQPSTGARKARPGAGPTTKTTNPGAGPTTNPGDGPGGPGGSGSAFDTNNGKTSIGDGSGTGFAGGSSSAPRDVPTGAGVDHGSVSIGIAYDINGSAYGAAFGISVSDVDQKAQAKGLVDYINAHGGVAGRRIAPVWHAVDLAASLHGSNEAQKSCAAFTQDARVFAAIGDVASECILKAGVLEINDSGADPATFAQYPNLAFAPSAFDSNGVQRATAAGLRASGFFSAMPAAPGCSAHGQQVGAIGFDLSKAQVQPLVTSAYAAAGVHIAKWGFVTSDSSNVQQIILDFKAACVTHIVTPEYSPLLLAQAAEAQGYRPLWGIGSTQNPQLLQKNVNHNQFVNFYGSGWSPSSDVDDAHDPGPLGPDARLCRSIMTAQRLPTDRLAMAVAYPVCDELFVLKAVFDHASALTPAGFRAAYERIGHWDSTVTFSARLGPGRHAGANGYRPMRVVNGVWTYSGGTRTI